MKIIHLLFFGCLFYVSVYDVRGNARDNIIEEFKKQFKDYVSQNLSNLCECAIEQLQKIQGRLQIQNSTEVVMMTTNLQALIEEFEKSGKTKQRTKRRGKQGECKFDCRDPELVEQKLSVFFQNLNKRNCFKDRR
ncbi:hypothetical protein GDO81_010673 [Engystomops pustulosus]|uniref:Uncharacterized protein n=1 Tax=Engystomops pustulosus TaxID=76066 RepID=A0AAV7C2U4_ENGPU|nr:hypothetical protein GDO81_010673 [Engystomops pustulosus]